MPTGGEQSETMPNLSICSDVPPNFVPRASVALSADRQVATFKGGSHAKIFFVSIPNRHYECPQRTHSAVYGAQIPSNSKRVASELKKRDVQRCCCRDGWWPLSEVVSGTEPSPSPFIATLRGSVERTENHVGLGRPHIHIL